MRELLFTSESVTEGHPDKIADNISDAILDAMLTEDPNSRVACETLVTTGMVVVAGEVRTTAQVDFQRVVRQKIKEIGYTRLIYMISSYNITLLNFRKKNQQKKETKIVYISTQYTGTSTTDLQSVRKRIH